jgi:1-acyl-sn-glycerol-3-phosphate acyltransferase
LSVTPEPGDGEAVSPSRSRSAAAKGPVRVSGVRTGTGLVLKSGWLILHLLYGLCLVALVSLDWRRRLSPERLTHHWNGLLLKILRVRLSVRGQPAAGARILVCNHISWLDIPVLAACEQTRFVSKAEVRNWPIAGWLATAAGTFYIKRGAGGTKRLIQSMSQHLQQQGSVVLFPEGTTTVGDAVLRFQPRLFAAAIETGVPVQPVALRYGRGVNGDNIAPFVGDDDLLSNLLRLLREPGLEVELNYCAPIPSQTHDRAALARLAHAAVSEALAPAGARTGTTTAETPLAA